MGAGQMKLSVVGAVIGLALLLFAMQYMASFKASVKTTQLYTTQMQVELKQAMEEQREAVEEARVEDGRHLEAVLSEVDSKVAELMRSQALADNTVSQQLETVAQQLKSALGETDRLLSVVPEAIDVEKASSLANSQEQLISAIDLLLAKLEQRQGERKQENDETLQMRQQANERMAMMQAGLEGQVGPPPVKNGPLVLPSSTEKNSDAAHTREGDPCVLDDSDEHPVADLEESLLMPGVNVLPQSATLVDYTTSDVYSITAEELFTKDENWTVIYRLGFPSTSSSNLRKMIERTAELTKDENLSARMPNCPRPTLVGCGEANGGPGNRLGAVEHFRKWAGRILCPADVGQHAVMGVKESSIWSALPEEQHFNRDLLLRTTMLREPTQLANRIFADKREGAMPLEEMKNHLGITSISGKYFFFDQSFEERTQCRADVVTMSQWVNLAHWRWNFFVRGMADDYNASLHIRFAQRYPETREEAWRANEEGKDSLLLATAIENLHTFPFFGIYDRIELSMELLAFTFCVDFEALGFSFVSPRKAIAMAEEHLMRGADVVGEEAQAMMRDKNRLDFLFFEYAEELFNERVLAMRQAQELGYRCKLADSSCGLVC